MTQEIINIGSTPNDGTGDPIRTAYAKCNNNFGELYSRFQTNPPTTLVGTTGDFEGMYAVDASYFYYCFGNYDGSSVIWAQVTQIGNVSVTAITNGTSSVSIPSGGGNIQLTVGGVSNVAVISTSGVSTGNVTVTGNITSGNLSLSANASIGNLSVSGNIQSPGIYGTSGLSISTIAGNILIGAGNGSASVVFPYKISNTVCYINDIKELRNDSTLTYDGITLGVAGNVDTSNVNVGNTFLSGLEVINPNVINTGASNLSITLSATTSYNILNNTGTGISTLSQPGTPINGQICTIAVYGNASANLVVGAGTFNPSFAGEQAVGNTFRYVYLASTSQWYVTG